MYNYAWCTKSSQISQRKGKGLNSTTGMQVWFQGGNFHSFSPIFAIKHGVFIAHRMFLKIYFQASDDVWRIISKSYVHLNIICSTGCYNSLRFVNFDSLFLQIWNAFLKVEAIKSLYCRIKAWELFLTLNYEKSTNFWGIIQTTQQLNL